MHPAHAARPMDRLLRGFLRFFFHHLYTTAAPLYDLVAWSTSIGQWRRWTEVALESLPPGRTLEIGHGPGHLLLQLVVGGKVAYGADASRQMTRLASRRLRRRELGGRVIRARAQELPFAGGSFSAILSTFPSEYILASETLHEIRRLLSPEGRFVIVPSATITGGSWLDRAAAWLYRATGQSGDADATWLDGLSSHGFNARIENVNLDRATVVRIVAEPEADLAETHGSP